MPRNQMTEDSMAQAIFDLLGSFNLSHPGTLNVLNAVHRVKESDMNY